MYAYYQVLSVLTNTQLQQVFERNPGFDLRYLLQGSEKFVDNILNMVDTDPSFLLNGVNGQNFQGLYRNGGELGVQHPVMPPPPVFLKISTEYMTIFSLMNVALLVV